jgi:stage V sporulation protein G
MDSQKIMSNSAGSKNSNTRKKINQKVGSNNNTQEVVMSKVTFKVEKMFRIPEGGILKAFADVSMNDALIIRGVRILESKKGVFVSMPQEQGKNNKWYDQVVCTSAEIYEALSAAVLEHYALAEVA